MHFQFLSKMCFDQSPLTMLSPDPIASHTPSRLYAQVAEEECNVLHAAQMVELSCITPVFSEPLVKW